MNEAGVGGLATATTQLERCNDSAEPSKESKDNLGWSGYARTLRHVQIVTNICHLAVILIPRAAICKLVAVTPADRLLEAD